MRRLEDGQVTTAKAADLVNYRRLKVLHQELLEASGQFWNWPAVATMTRPSLARLLYLDRLYEQVLDIPGVICEFGAHFGTSSAVLTNLRALKEPHNHARTLYVFDTFSGFAGTTTRDGVAQEGDFSVPAGYDRMLGEILRLHEAISPVTSETIGHRIYRGDASQTVHDFLTDAPHAVVSMVIFDMDIYKPTRDVLEALEPRLVRGSLLVFDELNHESFPGETRALDEVLGLGNVRLRKDRNMPYSAFAIYGE